MSTTDGITMVIAIVYVVVGVWLIILGTFDKAAATHAADDMEAGLGVLGMALTWPIIAVGAAIVGSITWLGKRARSTTPQSSSSNRGEDQQRGTT